MTTTNCSTGRGTSAPVKPENLEQIVRYVFMCVLDGAYDMVKSESTGKKGGLLSGQCWEDQLTV